MRVVDSLYNYNYINIKITGYFLQQFSKHIFKIKITQKLTGTLVSYK